MMRLRGMLSGLLAAALSASLTGCVGVEAGPHEDSTAVRMSGLVNGYVSVYGLHDFDGQVVSVGVLDSSGRPGELAHVDVWPVAGIGVGAAGARLRIFFLDMGVGTLFYSPCPPAPEPAAEGEDVEWHDEAETGEEAAAEDAARLDEAAGEDAAAPK